MRWEERTRVEGWIRKNIKRDINHYPIFAPKSMRSIIAEYEDYRHQEGFLGDDLRKIDGVLRFRRKEIIYVDWTAWDDFKTKLRFSWATTTWQLRTAWFSVFIYFRHLFAIWRL